MFVCAWFFWRTIEPIFRCTCEVQLHAAKKIAMIASEIWRTNLERQESWLLRGGGSYVPVLCVRGEERVYHQIWGGSGRKGDCSKTITCSRRAGVVSSVVALVCSIFPETCNCPVLCELDIRRLLVVGCRRKDFPTTFGAGDAFPVVWNSKPRATHLGPCLSSQFLFWPLFDRLLWSCCCFYSRNVLLISFTDKKCCSKSCCFFSLCNFVLSCRNAAVFVSHSSLSLFKTVWRRKKRVILTLSLGYILPVLRRQDWPR